MEVDAQGEEMKEELDLMGDALWVGPGESPPLKAVPWGLAEGRKDVEGGMWTHGVGQLRLFSTGRGEHLGLGPPPQERRPCRGPLEGGLFPRSGPDQPLPHGHSGTLPVTARLCCADSVAEADVYTQTLRHT